MRLGKEEWVCFLGGQFQCRSDYSTVNCILSFFGVGITICSFPEWFFSDWAPLRLKRHAMRVIICKYLMMMIFSVTRRQTRDILTSNWDIKCIRFALNGYFTRKKIARCVLVKYYMQIDLIIHADRRGITSVSS